ncbi:MAG: hypothetical protein O7D34_12835 [Ignavibacteria bacterium]|nr:hypothetical protein [Ignavibacteria bacterium]
MEDKREMKESPKNALSGQTVSYAIGPSEDHEMLRLIDRELGIGGLGNPPTVLFMAQLGEATLGSLVPLSGEDYRLVVAEGKILDTEELPHVEMPYFFFKPVSGVRSCLGRWLVNGGTITSVCILVIKHGAGRCFVN